HSGVGEEQRRIVHRDERGGRDYLMASLREVVEEAGADFVGTHRTFTRLGSCTGTGEDNVGRETAQRNRPASCRCGAFSPAPASGLRPLKPTGRLRGA